jgi:hypothetical protein
MFVVSNVHYNNHCYQFFVCLSKTPLDDSSREFTTGKENWCYRCCVLCRKWTKLLSVAFYPIYAAETWLCLSVRKVYFQRIENRYVILKTCSRWLCLFNIVRHDFLVCGANYLLLWRVTTVLILSHLTCTYTVTAARSTVQCHVLCSMCYTSYQIHRSCFFFVLCCAVLWVTIRRKQLLDDLGDRRGYSHLKEEALDRTKWRNHFGRGFRPVVWQNSGGSDDDDDV